MSGGRCRPGCAAVAGRASGCPRSWSCRTRWSSRLACGLASFGLALPGRTPTNIPLPLSPVYPESLFPKDSRNPYFPRIPSGSTHIWSGLRGLRGQGGAERGRRDQAGVPAGRVRAGVPGSAPPLLVGAGNPLDQGAVPGGRTQRDPGAVALHEPGQRAFKLGDAAATGRVDDLPPFADDFAGAEHGGGHAVAEGLRLVGAFRAGWDGAEGHAVVVVAVVGGDVPAGVLAVAKGDAVAAGHRPVPARGVPGAGAGGSASAGNG